MNAKGKGSNAERELIHAFWAAEGWTAVRVAGSGSIKYPAPDILAGNGSRRLAIECKASGRMVKYITEKQVNELQEFAKRFGAEAWIGMRFNDMKWRFLSIEDLNQSGNSLSASIELANRKGLNFEQLTGNF